MKKIVVKDMRPVVVDSWIPIKTRKNSVFLGLTDDGRIRVMEYDDSEGITISAGLIKDSGDIPDEWHYIGTTEDQYGHYHVVVKGDI